MALSMMRSSASAKVAGSRRPLNVQATLGGAKSTKGSSGSNRQAEVDAYLATLPGCTQPFYKAPWDPLNLTQGATVNDIRRWRESELVHGRVAMLAALGFVVGEQLEDFPAFFNFDGQITGQAINQFQQVRQGFWEPLLIFIGLCESYRVSLGWATPTSTGFNQLKEDYDMGNLYFDPLGLCPEDEDELLELKNKELNNGRLAMIAIAGFTAQELVSHREIFEHLFFTLEVDAIKEIDVIEKDLGLPPSFAVPELPKYN